MNRGISPNRNQTVVRKPWGTNVQHNQTIVCPLGAHCQHNQTLARR